MTRNGKIARLPRAVREDLNRRLADGESGTLLLAWLNGLPEARAVLAREFADRPVSAQNLSEWRLGGFAEWQRREEARTWVRGQVEHAADLATEAGEVPLADRLAMPVLVALSRRLEELLAAETLGPGERRELLAVVRELAQIRRGEHSAARLRLEQEAWAAKQAQLAHWQAASAFSFRAMPMELLHCLAVAQRLPGAPKPGALATDSE